MEDSITIGIDLGATNIKVAVVDRAAAVLAKRVAPLATDKTPDAVVDQMAELVAGVVAEAGVARERIAGVGLGSPGPLDLRNGTVIRPANLPGWSDVPIRTILAERIGLPVTLDNDVNMAALGEHWAGAGRDGGDLVMLALGTGVGGGVVIDGKVLHGHFDNAGELGHTIVVPDGLPCACGQRGCIEQYAAASTVARRVADAIRAGESSSLSATIEAGDAIDSEQVARAAKAGDALCKRIWDEACNYLAILCVGMQHAFNPATIVLGGGMGQAGGFLLDNVSERFLAQTWVLCDDKPRIVLAELGYDAGVIGAAKSARL